MLEGIIDIGNAVTDENDVLSNLIQNVESVRKKKQLYVLKFNFLLDEEKLEIDALEEMDSNSAKKYLFVGSASGPNSPQWFVTSTSSNYHLSETISNLSEMDLGEGLNYKIKQILKNYFVDLGDSMGRKYRYMMDLYKFGMTSQKIEEFYEQVKDTDKPGKNLLDSVKKELKSFLQDQHHINENQVGLYIILVNGQPLCASEEYQGKVIECRTATKDKAKKAELLICSMCQSTENVTSKLSDMTIKYYTTNQVIFASGLDKHKYDNNMLLCEECFNKLKVGETYIKNRLKTKLAAFDVYIVPHFVFGQTLNKQKMDKITDKLLITFNTAKHIDEIREFRDNIELLKEEESYFLINFIFYKTSNAATKIQKLIKDVNPSIFEKIENSFSYASELSEKFFQERYTYYGGLGKVYYMIPIRLSQGKAVQYKDVLDVYESILVGKILNKKHLIDNLIHVIKINWLEKEGYNIRGTQEKLHYTILDGVFFIKFLEGLDCLKVGEGMNVRNLSLKQNIKEYFMEMGYNEEQVTMFLLGYMVGKIGNTQYKKASQQQAIGYKPILNKINFNGMDKSKILRLTKDVFNKLRQEKILSYNETIFNEFKRILDKNINSWHLNKNENLFYLLSGYGYATTEPMNKKEETESE